MQTVPAHVVAATVPSIEPQTLPGASVLFSFVTELDVIAKSE